MSSVKYRTIVIMKQRDSRDLNITEDGWFDGYTIKGHLKDLVKEYNNNRDITWGSNVGQNVGESGRYYSKDVRVDGRDREGIQTPSNVSFGIVGLVRFLDCYYITFITRRVMVGCIGGEEIWSVRGTESVPLRGACKGEIIRGGAEGGGEEGDEGGGEGGDDGTVKTGGTTGGREGTQSDGKSIISQIWSKGKRSMGLGLTTREIAELRYQGLWGFTDLSKGFYFSYR